MFDYGDDDDKQKKPAPAKPKPGVKLPTQKAIDTLMHLATKTKKRAEERKKAGGK